MNFPSAAAQTGPAGYHLLIAWMPIVNGVAIPFSEILAGRWDAYMTRFFDAASRYGPSVTLRFCHEMNLGKAPWCVGRGGPTSTAEFIATWRYVHNLMKRVAASQVTMLWCISQADGPIPAEQYWPGLDATEKVGFDAYSGFTYPGWSEPGPMLTKPYTRLIKLAPQRPIWLCETGCRETRRGETHSKAKWMTDPF